MALSGRSLASAVLLGVAAIIFAPVFADAAAGASFAGWKYGEVLGTVLQYVPVLLVVAGVAILFGPVIRN